MPTTQKPRGLRRLFELAYLTGEYLSLLLISTEKVGPIARLFFRIPLLFYRLGLGGLIGGQVLLLTTVGRVSGHPHTTPVGYTYDPAKDVYYVTAGWRGRTDWYRNARANPSVHVQAGNRHFDCRAQPVDEITYVAMLGDYSSRNPYADRLWPRLTGQPFDGSEESLRSLAHAAPMLALDPGQEPARMNKTPSNS